MSEGLFDKVKYFMGIGEDEEYYEDGYDEYEEEVEEFEDVNEAPKSKKVNDKVVNLHSHTNSSMKIIVHEPISYEEAPVIVNDLKNRKTVVANLEQLNAKTKRQIFDFINGGLYSLEGNIQKVTEDIFILAPSNVKINGLKNELKDKGIY